MKKIVDWFKDEQNMTLVVGILFILPLVLAFIDQVVEALR